jgi:hypothetical protein
MDYEKLAKRLYNCNDADKINEVFDEIMGDRTYSTEIRKAKVCMQELIDNVKNPFELLMYISTTLFSMTCDRVDLHRVNMTKDNFISLLNRNVKNTYESLRRYYSGRILMDDVEMFKVSDNQAVANTFMHMNIDDVFESDSDPEEFIAKLLAVVQKMYVASNIVQGDEYLLTCLSYTPFNERVLDSLTKNKCSIKSKDETVTELNLVQLRYMLLSGAVSNNYVPNIVNKQVTDKTLNIVSSDDVISVTNGEDKSTTTYGSLVDMSNASQSFMS